MLMIVQRYKKLLLGTELRQQDVLDAETYSDLEIAYEYLNIATDRLEVFNRTIQNTFRIAWQF